jgi:hypothetical protein
MPKLLKEVMWLSEHVVIHYAKCDFLFSCVVVVLRLSR